ncbi:hypothetical protein [Sphingorhabdus sp. EL138]|uniref:hypothetical protein n=1 Tax=Sphingorhabdus sp. EL138 TaxID=2073156 RepID=UPI000D69F1D0|nr:hypothetical protein [Sphingorhabdus sp. EL138]
MLHESNGSRKLLIKQRSDIGTLLVDQIQSRIGSDYRVKIIRESPWASITFSGTRHSISITGSVSDDSEFLYSFATQLQEHNFDLPGHFVADLVANIPYMPPPDHLALEILTIKDHVVSYDRPV